MVSEEQRTLTESREQIIARLTAEHGLFELCSQPNTRGINVRAYATGPKTLRDVLWHTLDHGDLVFLVYEDERVTYSEHFHMVARLAAWLQDQGVAKGDRVAIGMRNYPEWAVGFFACQAIGAVAVTLNAWWTGQELLYGLQDSQTMVALLDGERYSRLQPLLHELPGLTILLTRDHAPHSDVPQWESALAPYTNVRQLPEVDIQPLDYASILYTSGTTGFPKGALHTHLNHATNIQNTMLSAAVTAAIATQELGASESTTPQPSSLQTFPFFHIGGLSGLYISATTGTKLVLMYKWDVEQAIDLINREQIRSWSGVPTVVRELLEHPRAASGELDSLISIASGGAPVPEDLIKRVANMFQTRVAPGNGYGATETTSAIIANGGLDYLAHPNSVGRPTATVAIRIVDDNGQQCERGEIGELWLQGANLFVGYWNRPEETEAAFSDGWFKTGDLGYRDADGFYYIVDRKKDVIIRGGENIYCAEVEGVLHQHPGIADVALIGLFHRELGEEVAAVVELKPGVQMSETDVQAHVADHLARFNVPSRIFFVSEPLPRTATGKVLKRELKEQYGP